MNERALCFAIGILEQYHVTPPRARGVTGPRQQAPYGTMGAATAEMQSAQAFQRRRGQAERAALLGFILFGSTLKDDQAIMAFKSHPLTSSTGSPKRHGAPPKAQR
jgi:hypothetical protein